MSINFTDAIKGAFSKKEFTIRVEDFNSVVLKPEMMKTLRKLTIASNSGLNYELNHLESSVKYRKVDCRILYAQKDSKIVGWALLSKEKTDYWFRHTDGYSSTDGTLFQVYIDPMHRRQGIASELIKVARRKSSSRLCIAPHDPISRSFFSKFENFKAKIL